MHSGTKYLAGHSDVIIGLLALNNEKIAENLFFIQNSSGAICGPMDAFLTLRGIKTIHVRMDRHCYNGEKVFEFLKNCKKVDKIYWPGSDSHPNHSVAKKQMKKFGGMISFTLHGNMYSDVVKFTTKLKVFTLAESLGGVESLVNHPATMTHASMPKKDRERNGITESLIRLSVGIEDSADLIKDLDLSLIHI